MSLITFYFNSYETGGASVWKWNPQYMVDGILGNRAQTDQNYQTQMLDGNTSSGRNFGTITKVEIRSWDFCLSAADLRLRPYFTGGTGDDHEHDIQHYPGVWSAYDDITTDTNAPSPWTWTDVENLEVRVQALNLTTQAAACAMVEVRVTFTPVDCGLRCNDCSLCCIDLESGIDSLRIRKGDKTYSVYLVDTDDPNASKVRIYDGSTIKSIKEL